MNRVAVDVERGDTRWRHNDYVTIGSAMKLADQRRLARARFAGQEDMPAAGQQIERMAKLVGEDKPVGYPRHEGLRYRRF